MGAPLAQPPAASSQPEGLAKQARIYSWILSRQCRSYHELVFFVSWVAVPYRILCFSLSCQGEDLSGLLSLGSIQGQRCMLKLSQDSKPGMNAMSHLYNFALLFYCIACIFLCDNLKQVWLKLKYFAKHPCSLKRVLLSPLEHHSKLLLRILWVNEELVEG